MLTHACENVKHTISLEDKRLTMATHPASVTNEAEWEDIVVKKKRNESKS